MKKRLQFALWRAFIFLGKKFEVLVFKVFKYSGARSIISEYDQFIAMNCLYEIQTSFQASAVESYIVERQLFFQPRRIIRVPLPEYISGEAFEIFMKLCCSIKVD